MVRPELRWWVVLVAISTVNALAATRLAVDSMRASPYKRTIAALCVVYTLVCGLRATFPVRIVERRCFRSRLVSPMVDRALATVAEMAFVVLVASVTQQVAERTVDAKARPGYALALGSAVAAIAIAQACCWCGCATRNQRWNAAEESLWAATATLFIAVWLRLYLRVRASSSQCDQFLRASLPLFCGVAALYVGFMVCVDVPMYLARSRKTDPATHRPIGAGLREMTRCGHATTRAELWSDDALWRIGYFSGAVWVSIALVGWYARYDQKCPRSAP